MKTFIITCICHQPKESLWLFSYDAIFTTFITIFIFAFGMLANALFAWKKEKSRLHDIRVYVLINLRQLIDKVNSQANSHLELSQQINDVNFNKFGFESEILIDPLVDTNRKDLFKIFAQTKVKSRKITNITHYSNLLDAIVYINTQKDIAFMNSKTFIQKITKLGNQWENCICNIQNKWNIYFSECKRKEIEMKEDPFLLHMGRIINNLDKSDNNSQVSTKKTVLIDPLVALCIQYVGNKYSIELMSIIYESNYVYDSIIKTRKIYSQFYQNFSHNLKIHNETISKAIDYYETV